MSKLRAVAEHEAAHAVVAAHFGARVLDIVITTDNHGWTRYEAAPNDRQEAAITAAGDLWQRHLGTVPYLDLACADLAAFERERGLGPLWRAQQTARQILTARREAVLTLAARLQHDGRLTFT